MHIYTRKEWGAIPARAPMSRQSAPVEAFIHHTADAHGRYRTLAEQKAKCRQIQRFHMDGNGWSDGGYHFLVFQPQGQGIGARAFALRPVEYVPAAQAGHNTRTLAISVVGNGETEEMQRNTRYVIEQIIARYPSVKAVGGHRDVTATSCPGDNFYQAINRIAKASGKRRIK